MNRQDIEISEIAPNKGTEKSKIENELHSYVLISEIAPNKGTENHSN